MKPIKLLIPLDSLFDTRLSAMLSINQKKAVLTAAHGYGRRRGDWVIWEGLGITEEAWRSAYKQRGAEILTKSVRSKILNVVKEIAISVDKGPRITPEENNLSITLNEYPYRLMNNVKDAIAKVVKELINPAIEVSWIRQSHKTLSPARLSSLYTHYIDYDIIAWLSRHIETDESSNMLRVELIGPALFQDKPTQEDFSTFNGVLDDIHSLSEQYVSPSWNIKFISVEYFNAPF